MTRFCERSESTKSVTESADKDSERKFEEGCFGCDLQKSLLEAEFNFKIYFQIKKNDFQAESKMQGL